MILLPLFRAEELVIAKVLCANYKENCQCLEHKLWRKNERSAKGKSKKGRKTRRSR